jgi:hypothetical protein
MKRRRLSPADVVRRSGECHHRQVPACRTFIESACQGTEESPGARIRQAANALLQIQNFVCRISLTAQGSQAARHLIACRSALRRAARTLPDKDTAVTELRTALLELSHLEAVLAAIGGTDGNLPRTQPTLKAIRQATTLRRQDRRHRISQRPIRWPTNSLSLSD